MTQMEIKKSAGIKNEPVLTAGDRQLVNQPQAVPEAFIGKPEVASRLQKTLRSVDNWMQLGILPYYKVGRSVLFKWSEVEAHLALNCRVTRPH